MSDLDPIPRWKSEPKTLSAAIGRIETFQQWAYWVMLRIENADHAWSRERADVRHYEGILEQRWKANDGRLIVHGCGVDGCPVAGCKR